MNLVVLSNIRDPNIVIRLGRGGNSYWSCDVSRVHISAAYNAADENRRYNIRQFLYRFRLYIHWPNYAILCGDPLVCVQLGLFAWHQYNQRNQDNDHQQDQNDDQKDQNDNRNVDDDQDNTN